MNKILKRELDKKTDLQKKIFLAEAKKLKDIVSEVIGSDWRGAALNFAEKVGINRGTVSKHYNEIVYHDVESGDVFKVKVTKVCNVKGK